MLVLSRKTKQRIYIPSIDATVEVLEIKGNTVRLGIQAPRNVAVIREEVRHPKQEPPRADQLHVDPSPIRGVASDEQPSVSLPTGTPSVPLTVTCS